MLLTFSTKNYSHWLDLLLRTYRKTNPGRKAKAYLIMEKGEFDKYENDDFFEYHWIPTHESLNMDIKKGKVRSALRLKSSLILWELILNRNKKIIWCDADCIVLKDVQPIIDKLDRYDLLATTRPWKPVDQQILSAGVMGLRSNLYTIELMARAAKDVWGHWEGWYSDQINIYKNLTQEIKHYSFTDQEHSLNNDKNTIIMSHHANKFEDLKTLCDEMGA